MSNSPLTDEEIVHRILKGERDLFAEIVRRYQRKIYNIGLMFFRNSDDAGDFAQEVFVRAYEALNSFKGKSKFSFWFTKIAYNHGINMAKSGVRPESLIEHACEGDSPHESFVIGEVRDALKRAVESLPENFRVCVDLYFFYGLSYAEISEITGYPVNTIKSNMFRAKQVLRNKLKGTIAEDYHEM